VNPIFTEPSCFTKASKYSYGNDTMHIEFNALIQMILGT
jgi:hypothetical protein